MALGGRSRNQRGVVSPSPVVLLSVVAVAMAGVAYVVTQDSAPEEREVAIVAGPSEPDRTPRQTLPSKKPAKIVREVQRGRTYVEVYNNSGITGLAGRVAEKAQTVGWQVVGADNWYGTVPASTVYYPRRLEQAARLLALDLGIGRVQPATSTMKLDRLTVVLTADAA